MAYMKSNVKMVYARFRSLLRQYLRRQEKHVYEISAPFNFKKEPTCFPGLSEEKITNLRENTSTSRIDIAALMPRSYSGTNLAI
ncbi:unnamed protein product [Clonostachys rosea]|uniref:Uncharacterized protein n=1 Tax=Bionectria ochroleuca TaxID=29856 RepID=A0ABY6TWI3_BIOOC|nr:unnamed protein product [Clonostachys rosea]